ncbi:MAG: hypothetical protein ACJA2M_001535 [Polaribacter sp.]|jgi:hypothetical protein
MNFKKIIVCCYILFTSIISSQNKNIKITGIISDSALQPIENATLLAKPQQENSKTLYAISDTNGKYTLNLIEGVTYLLSISHLSYNPIERAVVFTKSNANYNINLSLKSESLNEVIINYDYQPIVKSKDTITYNLKAFTNGNEFKMQDVLAKLPGIKVENGTIKVQGKTVTKLLVEGKPFFDGSTKLAIENIPANVMAKIEIISDYKESELLRNLADNEDLALNVVLKEDKKDFIFGDLEVGAGLDEFYSVHNAIFKYNPTSNFSFIGDINNFNDSSLNFSDLSRLVGSASNLFDRSTTASNLSSFASSNNDRFKSVTRFSAFNFLNEINDTFKVSGYAVYSNNDIVNKSASIREYLVDEQSVLENRDDLNDSALSSLITTIKLDYNPSSKQKWIYNANFLYNDAGSNNETLSNSEEINEFITNSSGKGNSFSHNLEGYLKINAKNTMGIALFHNVAEGNSLQDWFSNSRFLNFLPLIEESDYNIQQTSEITAQKFNFIAKNYWLASKFYHLFYNVGFNYKTSEIENTINQVLTDNSIVNFSEFSSNNPLSLSDLNIGLGIKTQINKVEVVLEAKTHNYRFNRNEIMDTNFFIEPSLNINYKIDPDIELEFDYAYTNRYLDALSYLQNIRITGFNSVILGNPNLLDERSHDFSLYFSHNKNIDKYFLDVSMDYSLNNPIKNNSIIQNGINQLSTPLILNIPEENFNINSDFGFIFNKSNLDFSLYAEWLKGNQVVNNNVSVINTFEYAFSSKYVIKLTKNTQINLKYKHSGSEIQTGENNTSTEDVLSINFDSRFLKNFIFKTDFSTHFVNDFSDNSQNYTLQNLYLGYRKPNSKFSYSLNFKNIYNNGVIIRNSFRNNLISSNQIFTLPRIFLLDIKYKF